MGVHNQDEFIGEQIFNEIIELFDDQYFELFGSANGYSDFKMEEKRHSECSFDLIDLNLQGNGW